MPRLVSCNLNTRITARVSCEYGQFFLEEFSKWPMRADTRELRELFHGRHYFRPAVLMPALVMPALLRPTLLGPTLQTLEVYVTTSWPALL